MPSLGWHHTAESKEKNRIAHLGQVPWNKGKTNVYSEATLTKMSESSKGEKSPCWGIIVSKKTRRKLSESKMGKRNHRYGKTPSIKTKQKMSIRMSGQNNPMFGIRGENAPNWKGGISKILYPREWINALKESIRQRDNYICKECHVSQGEILQKLSVHHIDYDKTNLNVNNLISLCPSCHTKTNYNREHWEQCLLRGSKCLCNI